MRYLHLLLILGLFNFTHSQSAWVKSKGEVYTQLSFNDISNYSAIFNKNGADLQTSRTITDRTLQWYTEYGFSNRITLVSSIPFKLLQTGEIIENSTVFTTIEKGNLNTFGNANLALRYKIYDGGYVISSQLQLELPTGQFNKRTGLRSGVEAFTLTPTVAIGKGKKDFFYQVYTGLFFRTNDYSNGFKFYIEGGKRFFNQLWVVAFLDVLDSFENGNYNAPLENFETFLFLNDNEYTGFGIKLIEELNTIFGLTAAFGGAISANLEAKQPSFNFGIYYKIKPKKKP